MPISFGPAPNAQRPTPRAPRPAPRAWTPEAQHLDVPEAEQVFIGITAAIQDARFEYGEDRVITAGYPHHRCVVNAAPPRHRDWLKVSETAGGFSLHDIHRLDD